MFDVFSLSDLTPMCLWSKWPFGNPIKTLSHPLSVKITMITFRAQIVIFTIHTCSRVQEHLRLFTHATAMSEKIRQGTVHLIVVMPHSSLLTATKLHRRLRMRGKARCPYSSVSQILGGSERAGGTRGTVESYVPSQIDRPGGWWCGWPQLLC